MPGTGPLMLDLRGTALTDDEPEILRAREVGGVILFGRNYSSPQQLADLVAEIRAIRPDLLLAVDHEGGRVQRFREGFTRLPAMAALGNWFNHEPQAALEAARACGWLLAAELRACGIDFSFAPVLDLDYGRCPAIGDRSLHRHGDAVVALAEALREGMAAAGMVAVGKHFPGHGYTPADSHTAIPVDERPLAELMADMAPFRDMVASGIEAIMPAHVIYPAVDNRPAGFSVTWLQHWLRGELKFSGTIFSDDLSMAGAGFAGDYPARAMAALEAGCDVLLVCNDPEGARAILAWLQQLPRIFGASARLGALRGGEAPADSMEALQGTAQWQAARTVLEPLLG